MHSASIPVVSMLTMVPQSPGNCILTSVCSGLLITTFMQVTDATLAVLASVTGLRSLHTGFTRISDGGIAALTALSHLSELKLFSETISRGALASFAAMPALASLSLACCYEVCSCILVQILCVILQCLQRYSTSCPTLFARL